MPEITRPPKIPRPGFPLFAHAIGQECKNIRGKQHVFGVWGNPEAARQEYLRIRHDLQGGRTPTPAAGVVTLSVIGNAFLAQAESRKNVGDITPRTWQDYYDVCRLLTARRGRKVAADQLRPSDFAGFQSFVASKYTPSRLSKTITVARMVFKWVYESDVIERMPKFGPDFRGESKRAVRDQKARMGEKMFTAAEIQSLLEAADPTLRAMILLGVNGGMGNNDIASRPSPQTQELADRLFLTSRGSGWVVVRDNGRRVDKLVLRFRKLLTSVGAYRKQSGFYVLRHVCQTIADDADDPIATAHVMGHADGTMGGVYRERISDERLRKVTDHVHQWLFREARAKPKRSTKAKRKQGAKRQPVERLADNPVGEGKPVLWGVG